MLTDLTAEVNKLQAEYAALSEEAREVFIPFYNCNIVITRMYIS